MPTTAARLKGMFPERSPVWYERVDFLLVWIFGTAAACFIYGPENPTQGFVAGLGFVSTIRLTFGEFEGGQSRAIKKLPRGGRVTK
jgi:hypothetical protein